MCPDCDALRSAWYRTATLLRELDEKAREQIWRDRRKAEYQAALAEYRAHRSECDERNKNNDT